MKMVKNKKAAMEMSVGTIVTIVLLMAVLIMGILLTQRIFESASGAIDLTDEQLKESLRKLYGEDKDLTIYPSKRLVEIKPGKMDEVGIGIRNSLQGSAGTKKFSYEVSVTDTGNCDYEKSEIENWIVVGKSEENIAIPPGNNDPTIRRVRFEIPKGTLLCTARFSVNVYADEDAYGSDFFDIKVK